MAYNSDRMIRMCLSYSIMPGYRHSRERTEASTSGVWSMLAVKVAQEQEEGDARSEEFILKSTMSEDMGMIRGTVEK
jgi:hypothetical protein